MLGLFLLECHFLLTYFKVIFCMKYKCLHQESCIVMYSKYELGNIFRVSGNDEMSVITALYLLYLYIKFSPIFHVIHVQL